MRIVFADGIPAFRFTFVYEVYSREIKIFSVPAKEGLPTSDVAVRRADSSDFAIEAVIK